MEHDRQFFHDVMTHWQHNPVDFIGDVCLTYDPRVETLKTMPFILFPRQKELIQFLQGCLKDKQSGLVEKCRDMGLTWLAASYAVWLWLFVPGASVGFGSRKEMLVDRIGDPDSIFAKLRLIISGIPPFMRPEYEAPYMKIINHHNGATITGEAGENIGRGARKLIFFVDESAHLEHQEQVAAALGNTTDVRIDISSVKGTGTVFHKKRMAGEVWELGKTIERGKTRVFIFDWREDPRKSQEWYDQERKKAENEGLLHIFAQEVDRDYSSAIERVIIPSIWVRAAIDAHVKLGVVPTGEHVAGQDIADGGGDKNALAIRHGILLQHISAWGGEAGDSPGTSLPVCIEHHVNELFYDSIGVGAGFKTGANTLRDQGAIPDSMEIIPWNAASSPQDPEKHIIDGDDQSPLNEDQYGNLKAQSWFRLRTRFAKTYKAVIEGEAFDPEEIISLPSTLPNLHALTMELSQAVYKYSANGKTIVDKVGEGSRSPNMADAVVMCYNPIRQPVGWFSL
jgi:hypothetical protein